MKFLIASDVHGSATATKRVLEIFKNENADKLILLGDVYNHGPRNVLPEGYDPMEVASILNANKDCLTVIKGNCDSTVDTMISEFDFLDTSALIVNGKTVILTHGHVYNAENPPKSHFDALVYGHFHTGFIRKENGKILVNVGSVSLPKNNTPKSLLIVEDNLMSLIDLDGNVIDKIEL